jgi:hypothetical protein
VQIWIETASKKEHIMHTVCEDRKQGSIFCKYGIYLFIILFTFIYPWAHKLVHYTVKHVKVSWFLAKDMSLSMRQFNSEFNS